MKRKYVILCDRPTSSLPAGVADYVVKARDYINSPQDYAPGSVKVLNLSHDFSYMGLGYYASLLAAARGHQVIPSINQLATVPKKRLWSQNVVDIEDTLNREAKKGPAIEGDSYKIFTTFGRTDDPRFAKTAKMLFERFQVPLLVVTMKREEDLRWEIDTLEPVATTNLDEAEDAAFLAGLSEFLAGKWKPAKLYRKRKHCIAVLINKQDPLPPSDTVALAKFQRSANRFGLDMEFIEKNDYKRLAEFDALFIRETTNVNHHTFRFATQAEALGMPVIDDPLSILRCTNKVFLAEVLRANNINAPKTVTLDRSALLNVDATLQFPMVLKIPDGAFSRGVVKVSSPLELLEVGQKLFKTTDLIIAQEFVPTEFDWRVGVLNGQPLYAAKYFMSRNHWQIANHNTPKGVVHGKHQSFAIEDVPAEVVSAALRAANLMGNGLYGVDLKQTENGVVVIEVNDNPSLDSAIEDCIIKDKLYDAVISEFAKRIAS